MFTADTARRRAALKRGRFATAAFVLAALLSGAALLAAAAGQDAARNWLLGGAWLAAMLSTVVLGAFQQLALYRLLQDMPTAKIRSAPQGYVELRGVVREAEEPIRCGKCGKTCLWFEYSSARSEDRVSAAGRTPDIIIDDGTGTCRVIAAGSHLWSVRWSERNHAHILPGDEIRVLGEYRTQRETPPPPRTGDPRLDAELVRTNDPRLVRLHAVRRRLQALQADPARMKIVDANKDGRIDQIEHDAMKKAVWHAVERDEAQGKPLLGMEDVIAQPRAEQDRLPFVIIVGSEDEAHRAMRIDLLRRAAWAVALTLGIAIVVGA